MSMQILTTAQPLEWMKVVERCPYDFYHLPQYHAVAEKCGEGAALLFQYTEADCSIALPLMIRSLRSVPGIRSGAHHKDATSVYGYPGPITSSADVPSGMVRNFQKQLHEHLLDMGVVAVFSRLHPILGRQENLLAGLGECARINQTVSIDLTLAAEAQRAGFRSSLKTALNKLRRKGMTCVHDPQGSYLDKFVDIYYETMRRVDATSGYFFPRDYFYNMWRELNGRIHLAVCLVEGEVCCGGLFVECNDILQYHLGATPNARLDLAPMKLLLDEMRIWANGRGLKSFHLGGGVTPHADDPLLHFKLGFSRRTHDFIVWRWVLDAPAYDRLCEEQSQWSEANGFLEPAGAYFPKYRTPGVQRNPLPVFGDVNAISKEAHV
jgi:hypothetical protein